MSTTGNEYEQPGVNYPDRDDAKGAEATPSADEPTRDEGVEAPPAIGEPAPDASPAPPEGNQGAPGAPTGRTEPSTETEPGDEPVAATPGNGSEPSHEAVGIGVVDDGASHHGQDAGRDTMSASEAQHTTGGLGTEQEQRLPAMAQNNASNLEKVAGIVAQTRADVATEPFERIVDVLRQRLTQAGVELPDSDIQELARQVSVGDAASPGEARTSGHDAAM